MPRKTSNVGKHRHGTQAELRARWNANGGRLEGFMENASGYIVSTTRARGDVSAGHVRPASMETFRSGDFNIPDGFQLTYNPQGSVRWRLYDATGRALNINSQKKINERTGVSVDYAGLMNLYRERRSSGQGGSGSSDPVSDTAPEPPSEAILQAVEQGSGMANRLRLRRGDRTVSSSSLSSDVSSNENMLSRYERREDLYQDEVRQAMNRYKAEMGEDELRQNLASSQAVAAASSGNEQAVVNAIAGATLPLSVSQVTNRPSTQALYQHRDDNGNVVPGYGWHAIVPEEGGNVRYYPPMIGDKWEEMDIEDSPGRLGYWTSFEGAQNHINNTRGFYPERNMMADSNFSHSLERLNAQYKRSRNYNGPNAGYTLPNAPDNYNEIMDPFNLGQVTTRLGRERAFHGYGQGMTPLQTHNYATAMQSNNEAIMATIAARPDRIVNPHPAAGISPTSGGRMTDTIGPGYENILNRIPRDVLTEIIRDYQYPRRRSGRKRK